MFVLVKDTHKRSNTESTHALFKLYDTGNGKKNKPKKHIFDRDFCIIIYPNINLY